MENIKKITKRFNFTKHKEDLLPQIRSFTILLGILPNIGTFIYLLFGKYIGLDKVDGFWERLFVASVFALILSPFVLHFSIKRKKYFEIIATLPALNLLFLLLTSIFYMIFSGIGKDYKILVDAFFFIFYVIFFLLLPSFSVGYLIKKREMNKYSLIAAFLLTGTVFIGVFYWILFLLQLAVVILVFYVILYASYHGIKDNVRLLINLGRTKLKSLFLKAFLYWAPMLIIIMPFFYISSSIEKFALKSIDKIAETGASAPKVPFNPKELECGWNPLCYLNPIKMIQKQINYQWRKVNVSVKVSQSLLFISEILRTVLEIIILISNIILVFLIIKSFLYVFSRVAVSVWYNLPATLEVEGATSIKGKLRKLGHEYELSNCEYNRFYAIRALEPSNCAPKIALPQPKRSFFARILSKAYIMNEIQMRDGQEPIRFTATGSAEFIEWDLEEKEQIVFSYKSFVAMSETVRLTTVISFRLTTLIFGGVFHSCAQGPGKVVFLTRGKANCFEDGTQAGSAPLSRIIAWHRNARFDVISEINIFDIFLSGIYLKPASTDAIIIDADERSAPKTGLAQFIKKFLLPI